MKRSWHFTEEGRVRFRFLADDQTYDDEFGLGLPGWAYSTKKIAQAMRNAWIKPALYHLRTERKKLEEKLSQNKRTTRKLLKVQRKLEKYPPVVDLRSLMPPVLDQGDLNAGAACALASALSMNGKPYPDRTNEKTPMSENIGVAETDPSTPTAQDQSKLIIP